jgi:hypothetical protein
LKDLGQSTPVEGYQVLALGPDRYLRMAVACAVSLRRVDPDRPIQLVTDDPAAAGPYCGLFSEITRFQPAEEIQGPLAKLKMHEHLVFDRTMYIDGDCIAFRNIEFFWKSLSRRGVAFLGTKRRRGQWYGADISTYCRMLNVPFVVKTNTGFMYLTRESETKALFDRAWSLWERHGNFTGHNHRGAGPSDEPFIGVAHGQLRLDPYPWEPAGGGMLMNSTVGSKDFLFDMQNGVAYYEKAGRHMAPAIVHFVGGRPKDRYEALVAQLHRELKELQTAAQTSPTTV